jgi:hypothetical protein
VPRAAGEILALKWTDFGTPIIPRRTVHGRIGCAKTGYSEDEMPLDSAFAEVVMKCGRYARRVNRDGSFPTRRLAGSGTLPFCRHLCPGRQVFWNRSSGWHMLRQSYRPTLDAYGAPAGVQHTPRSAEHHAGRERLNDGEGEGARRSCADVTAASGEITSVSA